MKYIYVAASALLLGLTACSGGDDGDDDGKKGTQSINSAFQVNKPIDHIDEMQSFRFTATPNSELAKRPDLKFVAEVTQGASAVEIAKVDGKEDIWTAKFKPVDQDTNVTITFSAVDLDGGVLRDEADKPIQVRVSFKVRDYARTPLSSQWGSATSLTPALGVKSVVDLHAVGDTVYVLGRKERTEGTGDDAKTITTSHWFSIDQLATDRLGATTAHSLSDIESWSDARSVLIDVDSDDDPDLVVYSPTAGKVTAEDVKKDSGLHQKNWPMF